MKQSTLVAVLLTFLSTSAFADNEKGLYAGVGAGQFNVKVSNVNGATFDSDDTVYKIFGGWRFSPIIGVELDYIDLGSPSDSINNINIESKINGWAPYFVATLPLGPIEFFGRVGYYFYNIEVKGTASSIASSIDESDKDMVYGVGIGLTLFEHLNARLEYEEFDLQDTKKSNAVWLSAAWRF